MLRDDATIRHTVSFRLRPEADQDAFLGRFGALADIDGVQDMLAAVKDVPSGVMLQVIVVASPQFRPLPSVAVRAQRVEA